MRRLNLFQTAFHWLVPDDDDPQKERRLGLTRESPAPTLLLRGVSRGQIP